MISQDQFNDFNPYQRGYMVRKFGDLVTEPNIPNEINPYKIGSNDWQEWNRGKIAAEVNILERKELDV